MLAGLLEANAFDHADDATRRRATMERLRELVRHVLAHSRFYARDRAILETLLGETEPERFFALYRQVKPLTKDDLVDSFDALVTDPALPKAKVKAFDEAHGDGKAVLESSDGPCQVLKTSGTSGKVVYVVDRVSNIRTVMSVLLFRTLVRVLWVARMWPVLLPFGRPLYRLFRGRHGLPRRGSLSTVHRPTLGARIARFFRPAVLVFVHRGNRSVYRGTTSFSQPLWTRLLLGVHVLSHEESLTGILARTQWLDPEFVFGLPSRIEWLARAKIAGEIAIDPLAIYVGGETLHDDLKSLFRRAWPHALLINTYGATETKAIATACAECGELHLLEDIVHVELYDAEGRPTAAGSAAEQVFVTSLRNEVLPVLRYAMTDRVVPLPDAGCRWRTRRIRVEGREPAFLWAPHREKGEWMPLNGRMLKESLVAIPDSRGFLVRYVEPGRIELRFVTDSKDPSARERIAAAAGKALDALCADQGSRTQDLFPHVELEVLDAERWNREGGKLDVISASVTPPELAKAETSERGAGAHG
ncbi:MAG: hypothetical protein U0230_22360 [Polyangiales bacterium]